jgi:dipeptidyl aminopeptidase/acylaminoacyl peptidase
MQPEQPALPAAAYGGGRRIGDPQLAPGANKVSFVASYAYSTELIVMDVTNDAVETWLPLVPSIVRGSGVHAWKPDGSGLIYVGRDNRLHAFDFYTSLVTGITSVEHDISALTISPDGLSAAYVDDLHDLLIVDLASGDIRRLSSDADFVFDPAWSSDSQYVAWHEWDVPNMPWDGGRIVVRRADGSDAIRTVAGGDNISVQQPRFSPDGRHLAFLSDETGWLNLWTVDAETFTNKGVLVDESFEHGDAAWGPAQRSYTWVNNGAGVMYCRNEGGFGRLIVRDIAAGESWPADDQDIYSSLHTSKDATIALRSGGQVSTDLTLVTRTATRTLARTDYAGLEKSSIIPESVEWASTDGTLIHGRLYRAINSNNEPRPLLLWLHGGPADQSRVTMFARWNYFLARNWSVLVVDYRGTTGWGREYAQALRGNWGVVDVHDAYSGAQAAIENGWAQADAIVPFGGSAGGFTALRLMIDYPDMWRAGVTMYPVTDLVAAASDSWRFEAHYTDSLIGPLSDAEEVYRQRSPIEKADKITAPLLVLHGDNDIVVPTGQSEDLVQRLKAAGRTVEFHVYEGEGHGWRQPATRIDELERVEAFLNRYVLGQTPRS